MPNNQANINTKSYIDFIEEISAEDLYEGLLGYGLFTDRLPPVFTSISFLNYCNQNTPTFSGKVNGFISHRSMRNIGVPRAMGIPTPMKYQQLCTLLKTNWPKIIDHFRDNTKNQKYRISRIHIRKQYNSKRLFEMNYKNWHFDGNPEIDLLIQTTGACRFLIHADISTCFPSIYTHSIPWALVGKSKAKQLKSPKNKSEWFNQIDHACQAMKSGETHGLLIGPHASNLLSEIILVAVDHKLCEKYTYIRNIDDYECFVKSHEEAQLFLRDLEEQLKEFDLVLNHKKTKITTLPVENDQLWKNKLNAALVANNKGFIEYQKVNNYIDMTLSIAKELSNFAVARYAIKTLAGMPLTPNARKLATKRFMHMAILYPYLLSVMDEFVFAPYKPEIDDIKELANSIIIDAERVNDYESMCFAIYFALKYDFRIHIYDLDHAEKYISKQKDCIFLIMSWLYYSKNFTKDSSLLSIFIGAATTFINDDEMDRYWLFCYETLPLTSLPNEWKEMKRKEVSFIKPEFLISHKDKIS